MSDCRSAIYPSSPQLFLCCNNPFRSSLSMAHGYMVITCNYSQTTASSSLSQFKYWRRFSILGHAQTNKYIYIYTFLYLYSWLCMYVCMYVCIYIYIYIFTYTICISHHIPMVGVIPIIPRGRAWPSHRFSISEPLRGSARKTDPLERSLRRPRRPNFQPADTKPIDYWSYVHSIHAQLCAYIYIHTYIYIYILYIYTCI